MRRTIIRYCIGLLVIPAAVVLVGRTAAATVTASAVALPAPVVDAPLARAPGEATAIFAGGCFWGIEAVFEHVKGVKSATSGYTGGRTPSPTYQQIGTGSSGHAEAVSIVYDPSRVTYGQLLRIFFSVAHDPTQLNRQGPDVGTQYRSAIFYADDDQKRIASAYVDQIAKGRFFSRPIVTQLTALKKFHIAEEYHQEYAALHPNDLYIRIHDAPKVEQLKRNFKQFYIERR